MGIRCEFITYNRTEEVFVPGFPVSGEVKYTLSEEMDFNKITVSLKGTEIFTIDDSPQNSGNDNVNYLSCDNVIYEDGKGTAFSIGTYNVPFSFDLPNNIPSSYTFEKHKNGSDIVFKISYYIRIKFERPGLLHVPITFKKDIKIVSSNDMLLMEPSQPTTFEIIKKFLRLFSKREKHVCIQAKLQQFFVSPGGLIRLGCIVYNDTNIDIREVEIRLIEITNFALNNIIEEIVDEVKTSNTNLSKINKGETKEFDLLLDVPSEISSLCHPKLSINYFICITAVLPIPHRNIELRIPIDVNKDNKCTIERIMRSPPSYWIDLDQNNNVM